MRILKKLNKKNLVIISLFFLFFLKSVNANEPVDIWNTETQDSQSNSLEQNSTEEKNDQESVYDLQKKKRNIDQ